MSNDDPKTCNCDNLLWVTIDDLFNVLKDLAEIVKSNIAVVKTLDNRISELEQRQNCLMIYTEKKL